uniref:Retrotransposon protein-like n=1 Tax=Oryza barthii TaxID=65489 RepID=A0A679BAY2_9ORYZ|nr:retrotransposon protein-like [Oryza barthii]BBF89315.1 retrotransposon protein-like [Oryza barthii]
MTRRRLHDVKPALQQTCSSHDNNWRCPWGTPTKLMLFRPANSEGVHFPHQDPLVISAIVAGCEVRHILVDGGSSANIISTDAYMRIGLPTLALSHATIPLLGFGGESVHVLGQVQLRVSFNTNENKSEELVTFNVVDTPYHYNDIFGKGTRNKIETVTHHNYLKLKMSGPSGTIVIKGL